jgi:alcohol dehydrogenase (cytochrome c)
MPAGATVLSTCLVELTECRRTNGQKLWGQKLSGAIGGGVITFTANGAQKVAVAIGFISPVWPVPIASAKFAILGLEETTGGQ